MRKLFFILLAAFCMTSCGDDDAIRGKKDVTVNEEGNIHFSLLNDDLKETRIFREGDNIVFDFSFENTSDFDLAINTDFDGGDLILDNDFFLVYKENGERVDTPYSGMFCEDILMPTWNFAPHTTYHIYCWWYPRAENLQWLNMWPTCGSGNNSPHLPKGRYYCKFSVQYNTNIGHEPAVMRKQDYVIYFKVI